MPNAEDFPIEMDENGPFVQLGDYEFKIDMEDLEGAWKERAQNELRECPENIEYSLRELKKLLAGEEGLNIPLDDDTFLIKFLRPCKYYPDSAFRVMKRYYSFRVKNPKYAGDITPNTVRRVFDEQVFVFLPNRNVTGTRLKIINCGSKWNPKSISLEDMFKGVMVGVEIAMREPKSQVAGAEVILNMEGLGLTHIYQFSPSLAKLMMDWVQQCTPIRLKGIHIINQPYLFKVLFAMFKPFLGEKLRKRIFFHGYNKKSLFEKIPPECLPPYLGGTANIPDYPGSVLSEMLYHYEDDFTAFNAYGYVTKAIESNGKEIECKK